MTAADAEQNTHPLAFRCVLSWHTYSMAPSHSTATHQASRPALAPTSRTAASRGVLPHSRRRTRSATAMSASASGSTLLRAGDDGVLSVAVVGDLHLDPGQLALFHEARTQIRGALSDSSTVRA